MNRNKEEEIPLTEDLMKEHGLLNRVLLVYEEIIKRINNNEQVPLSSLSHAIAIIKSFIHDYHEQLEEDYIFPLFEKRKIELKLISTLKKQHIKGREITARLMGILDTMDVKKSYGARPKKARITIRSLLNKFVTMYRPHEAREDTVLFPQVRSLLSKKEFEELSEKFESTEHELFGKEGFEGILKKVEKIEKELCIYKLDQFTPVDIDSPKK